MRVVFLCDFSLDHAFRRARTAMNVADNISSPVEQAPPSPLRPLVRGVAMRQHHHVHARSLNVRVLFRKDNFVEQDSGVSWLEGGFEVCENAEAIFVAPVVQDRVQEIGSRGLDGLGSEEVVGFCGEEVFDRGGDFGDDCWLVLQDQLPWRRRVGFGEGGKVVAFSSAKVYQEDLADGRVKPFHEAFGDGVEVRLEPHVVPCTVGLHEVVEVASLCWVRSQPGEETKRGLHPDLEWARDGIRVFVGHTREVFWKSVEGLPRRVVAEQNAVLKMRSSKLITQRSCKPDSIGQHVDHRAGFQVTKNAFQLVLVV